MMRHDRSAIVRMFVICMLSLFSLTVSAQSEKKEEKPDGEPVPVYKPPLRGAPASRVGGGSRGIGTELPRIYVLAPPDIGFTTRGKPDLFWFVSSPTDAKVVLTVYTDDPNKPLLEQTLAAVAAPGIQRIKLSSYPFELEQRVEYRWRVTLINEGANRQARAIAGGVIQRTNPWPKLQSRLQNVGALERAHVYAEEGLWYDALEVISDSADAERGNPKFRRQRAALLEQVGLVEAGQFEAGNR